ncbi:MAG TPA: alpha/beta fold hydrolase, partial [Syntrophomonadaceae bacterium]|nr:alpha/beta fold hydrolase [Syntrophomonadaceae bacterium]
MPYALVDQIRMYYEIEGSGSPLVLIPGMGSSLDVWAPSFRHALSRKNRILLLDNRGTGRSDAPDSEYSVPMMAQDLSELMDKVGIERGHIMGLSLGAMIAQELALNHPHKVASLILCSTHCGVKHYIPFPQVDDTDDRKDSSDAYEDSIIRRMYPREFIENHPDQIKDIIDRETRYTPPAHIFERIYQA